MPIDSSDCIKVGVLLERASGERRVALIPVRGPKDVDVIRRCPAITLGSRVASQRGLVDENRHTVFNSEGY